MCVYIIHTFVYKKMSFFMFSLQRKHYMINIQLGMQRCDIFQDELNRYFSQLSKKLPVIYLIRIYEMLMKYNNVADFNYVLSYVNFIIVLILLQFNFSYRSKISQYGINGATTMNIYYFLFLRFQKYVNISIYTYTYNDIYIYICRFFYTANKIILFICERERIILSRICNAFVFTVRTRVLTLLSVEIIV